MATFISHSVEQTAAFGEELARKAGSGLVLGLIGDLGAGKTQFVKGFARGLSVTEPVLSPTFALLHLYTSGRLPLYHMDFYRLDGAEQIRLAGLDEYFTPEGVTVIEWFDRWAEALPLNVRQIRFETIAETERRIAYDDPGN